jgi:hypothetical protein
MSLRDQSLVFFGADNTRTEWQVFQAFFEIQPDFAGRPLRDWERGADPPDILCHDFLRKRIGVELTEWINANQIASSKAGQELYSSLSQIIRSEREIPPRNIEFVTLGLRGEVLPSASEQEEFRCQLFDCIREVDGILDASPLPRGLQDRERRDFSNQPALSKYAGWIKCWPLRQPSDRPPGTEWVRFPSRSGFYNPKVMVDSLIENIRKKTAKYSTLRGQHNLDELYLVVYYSQALLYNTPYSTLGFGFRDVADAVSHELATNAGHFQKVFLFSPVETGEKVLKVWPLST